VHDTKVEANETRLPSRDCKGAVPDVPLRWDFRYLPAFQRIYHFHVAHP
jgi:hypothetical protein